MSTPALRPSFRMPLRLPPDEAIAALERGLAERDEPIMSQRAGHHMTLTVKTADRHFWSPWLNLEFETTEAVAERGDDLNLTPEDQTSLHARFSPAPSLWTGFMAVYFSLATAGFLALMWAAAQWTMGARPTLLWVTLACALGCGGLWWFSLVGQRLAHDQMHLLRGAVEQALDTSKHAPTPEAASTTPAASAAGPGSS